MASEEWRSNDSLAISIELALCDSMIGKLGMAIREDNAPRGEADGCPVSAVGLDVMYSSIEAFSTRCVADLDQLRSSKRPA